MAQSLRSDTFLPTNLFADRMRRWNHGGIRVTYRRSLDGNGSLFAQPIIKFFRDHLAVQDQGKPFKKAFEWCSGPGFIGFALLAEGLCETLCLADINPRAIECIARTVKENNLQDRVTYYLSDNLTALPPTEKFDLVVGNPPWFCALNPEHPIFKVLSRDLRVNDHDWKIHEGFYRNIGKNMVDNAIICMSENEVFTANVILPGFEEPYDIRPRPPIEDFQRQMEEGGLSYVDTLRFHTPYHFDGEMVISAKAPKGFYKTSDFGWGRKIVSRRDV